MYLSLKKFYKNKRVLITGNTGFKGAWITLMLNCLGARVMGYSLAEMSKPNMFELLKLKNNIRHISGDINDFSKVKKEFDKFKPQIIIHLAAQSIVRLSYKKPLETFSTNILGSANILEYSRHCKSLKSLIYVTSDKCYENKENNKAYKESDRIGGSDPYSASKAAAENLFSSYLKSFFVFNKFGASTVRSGNVIGGGDWSVDRIIPDIIKSLKKKKNLIVRNPNSTRPWQHVLEPLTGYLILAMKNYGNKKFSGAWNFGPTTSETISVKNVVLNFYSQINYNKKKIKIQNKKSIKMKESVTLKINSYKARKLLKWKSKMNTGDAINLTCEWYKRYFEKKELIKFTNNQILNYLKK